MTLLSVNQLNVRYGSFRAVKDVSFGLDGGDWLMLVGPNGAGKSTVLNAVSGGLPFAGSVQLFGRDLRSYRTQELARRMGMLHQSHQITYGFTVREIVELGGYAKKRGPGDSGAGEPEVSVESALRATGLTELADRSVLTLSGGELQRAFLAQLFVQNPGILLLDEPANHLDLVYQKQIFELIRAWLGEPPEAGGESADGSRAVISVVHDLSLARTYGTKALLLCRGETAAIGTISDVFDDTVLNPVYDMDVRQWMSSLYKPWA